MAENKFDEMDLDDAVDLVIKGDSLFCLGCGAVLNVNTYWDEVVLEHGISAIWCPQNDKHIQIRILTRRARDFINNLVQESRDAETCEAIIIVTCKLPLPLEEYNVYVDGNIECDLNLAKRQHKRTQNGGVFTLTPGEHRIVVRESNVKKKDRMESNTIWFTASEGNPLHFEVGLDDGKLALLIR